MSNARKRLGRAVFHRRVDIGLNSRRALAEAAGVGKRTVDSLETGERVSDTSLYKIERALGWEPGSSEVVIEGGDPILGGSEGEPDDDATPSDDELLKMANDLAGQLAVLQEHLRKRA